MLTLLQSNHMEVLANHLAETMHRLPLSNPFEQDVILVQSPGMSQWLKITLAEKLGIAANITFPLPSSFIWTIYQSLFTDLPEKSAFNKVDMTWKIFELLPSLITRTEFGPLNQYLEEDNTQLKRYQLSEKIADVFDQYLMYRPDWILNWENNEDEIIGTDITEQPWQPILWRAIVEQTEQLAQSPYHRTNLHSSLIKKLEQIGEDDQSLDLPSRLFVFGISTMPRQQLEVFEHVAKHVDVYLFHFNPCQHYWGDILDDKMLAKVKAQYPNLKSGYKKLSSEQVDELFIVGNPLLASLGSLGKDYIEELTSLEAVHLDDFKDYSESVGPSTLLNRIQSDILNLSFRDRMEPLSPAFMLTDEGKYKLDENESSIVVNSTHNPVRELEVLHDHLLSLFEANPELEESERITPKDIIVMMPDVAEYGPYIEAVFSSVESAQYIPYAISDRGVRQENPILESFLSLLMLPKGRFSASEVLDILQVPAIMNKFELVEDDLQWIGKWVSESGIRWGIDDKHKQALGFNSDDLNTWLFGIKRALLGVATNDSEMYKDFGHSQNHIVPYTEVEGQYAVVLGKLAHFIQCLIQFRADLSKEKPVTEHISLLNGLIDTFYLPQELDIHALQTARESITSLQYHVELGNIKTDVSSDVIYQFIASQLNEKGVGQRFLAGKVNFCTLMPMRSIPFKVVCLVGMNDGVYPRFVAPTGFDLIASGVTRKGDRSRRLEDRFLFLEALLSARQQLYISFNGRSSIDNSKKVPSVVVSELLEYIEQSVVNCSNDNGSGDSSGVSSGKNSGYSIPFVTEHPLQPFNPKYFSDTSHYLEDNNSEGVAANATPTKTTAATHRGKTIKSYKSQWVAPIEQNNEPNVSELKAAPTVFVNDHIEMEQFAEFWRHPIKYFFNNSVSLKVPHHSSKDEDDELFTLNGLSHYQLLSKRYTERLYSNKLSPADVSYDLLNRSGLLPQGGIGEIEFNELEEKTEHFIDQIQQSFGKVSQHTQWQQIEIDVALTTLGDRDSEGGQQASRLVGWIKVDPTRGILFTRPAKIKATDLLNAWIHHLASCATGHAFNTHLVGVNKAIKFNAMPSSEAQLALINIFNLYVAGLTSPLAFIPQTSLAWAESEDEKKLKSPFEGNSFSGIKGEKDDYYTGLCFKELSQLPDAFYHVSIAVFGPLLAHIKLSESE